MSFIGVVAALATFLGVWFGHVAVRKIEFISPTIWIPTIIFTALGILTEYFVLITDHWLLNTALGILGITLLFDALEFTRQQNRIKKGHAPANPGNPRHARILAEYPSATTIDLLKREPVGHPLTMIH
jgi:putative Mn2+ efflux pump MntP